MKISKRDLLSCSSALNEMANMKMGPALAFTVAKNLVRIAEIVEAIQKSYRPVEGWNELLEERRELIKEYNGSMQPNGGFVVPPDLRPEFEKAFNSLNSKHQDVVDSQAAYDKDFEEDLDTKTEVDLEKIDIDKMGVDIEPSKLVVLLKAGLI